MKLFWSSRSPYARKVMVVAHELGLADAIECVPVVVTLRTREPAVVAHNPLGQVPTLLTDEGEAIYGSAVICGYLATLAPAVAAPGFSALTRQSLGDGMTDALIRWYSERSRADPKTAEYVGVARQKVLDGVAWLERDRAVSQDGCDVGAAAIACALAYADFRFVELDWRGGHERVAAWYGALIQRPSFRATEFAG